MMTSSMYTSAGAQNPQRPGLGEASFFEQVFRARQADATVDGSERPVHAATRERHAHGIRVEVASTKERLLEAATLVQQRYEWRGYTTSTIQADAFNTSRPARTLVAIHDDAVIGTMTLGFDGPDGLWIDHTYPDEMAAARANGRVLCELTRLAVTPDSDSRRILSSMFALAYRIGRIEYRATDLYIEVNPRHVAVYRKLFGFTAASDVRVCGRVKAPAVLLRLDIERLDSRLGQYLGQISDRQPDARPVPRARLSPYGDAVPVAAAA